MKGLGHRQVHCFSALAARQNLRGVVKDTNAKAGSINQNLCGCGLGIFLGIQSSPGESDEQPGSRSSDGVQWFSRLGESSRGARETHC